MENTTVFDLICTKVTRQKKLMAQMLTVKI